MIVVGIHNNVKLTKAVLKDDPGGDVTKKVLVVTCMLDDVDNSDLIGSFETADDNYSDDNEQDFYMWPIDNKGKDGTGKASFEEVFGRVKTYQSTLNHILHGYATKKEIEKEWVGAVFAGTGITNENVKTQLLTEPSLIKVYQNISNKFIEIITPHITGNDNPKFRGKFVRQSKAKHFSKIPKFAPFWEPMDIPKEQSKLAFSKWEKDNGFDSGTEKEAPRIDEATSKEQTEEISDMFKE